MDSRVQCPVCTLYLHSGMTLESHLDTHPKDQVIKALCSLSSKNTNYGSRTTTPSQSERSYQSRSRTPAADDGMRWMGSHQSLDSEKYWRRTPSRSKLTPLSNPSRNVTPDIRIGDVSFENNHINHGGQYSENSYTMKLDKTQQTYASNVRVAEFDQQYPYYPEQSEDREIKYSRSLDYNTIDSAGNAFTYNMPQIAPKTNTSVASTLVPPKKSCDLVKLMPKPEFVKLLPKSNNILFKNMSGVQYIAPGVNVVMPSSPFVQKNVQSNMIMSGNLPPNPTLNTKGGAQPIIPNQYNQMGPSTFSPGTTVVTQNSQIIYREMVHNLDGKPFISTMPNMLGGHDNMGNVTQSSSIYQNVVVVDQFGNTSCMYANPQQILQKPCNASIYPESSLLLPNEHKKRSNDDVDCNKTLIIEVSPINTPATARISDASGSSSLGPSSGDDNSKTEETELKNEPIGTTKGLKILSNIKVEVPVQHKKSMLNTVMDLTGTNDQEYPERSVTPEKILPDLEDNNQSFSDECTQPSVASGDSLVSNAFSVIKNVGNPPAYKDSPSKSSIVGSKIETDFSDSCPVPDLICNEKPSISPCSELSEHGDNSTDNVPLSPKADSSRSSLIAMNESAEESKFLHKESKKNTLRLNNIYVKKHKKILQIKNAKTNLSLESSNKSEMEPLPSSSMCKTPENFSMNKIHHTEKIESPKTSSLHTVSIEKLKGNDHNEFDADTEEQSMDIEPIAPSSLNDSNQFSMHEVKVKEEFNTSNEGGFSNQGRPLQNIPQLESLRPINVISYCNMVPGDFDNDSNHRELLDLEASSKNKQFVNMMNENYFGDNIYADYFTPDRVESFAAQKESSFREGPKDNMYIWGEPSQKESEFVLPNFIHESYKIAESNGADYSEMGEGCNIGMADRCEQDSKVDMLSESRSEGETPLNICADERMPPRGELSGQESNGDMESPWSGMYNEVTPSEPYDLMARESWVSDGSDVDANEKRDNIEDELHFAKSRLHTCSQCGIKYPSLKELRAHKALAHSLPTCSNGKTSYSRLVTARSIKKEEKLDETVLERNLLTIDSKESMATTMQQVYDAIAEAKPAIETLVKQETKRKKKDYICPTCKVDQLTEVSFNAHLKIHPLECLTCGKCFFKRGSLALHMKTHLGIKNFKCDLCEKRFVTRQKLTEHRNVHTGRMPIKCTVCDDTFRRYSNMAQHRDRHHFQKRAKVRDFVCHCGAVYHSRAKLLWHKETHDSKPKSCLFCSDKFVHSSSLTRHVRRTHNAHFLSDKVKGKEVNVPCPVCKQIYLRSNLRAHLLIHSGKKPYPCVICNKSFTTKWNLKLHRWTHMSRSAKPFKCHLCKGAFIRYTEYISHMNSHKSLRPYTCNYCGCQFIRKYNCQRHVREHEMAKKFVCKVPECGKSFHRSYYLSEHMKVHSGARPFSCNICGKTSSNKSNHNKHVKIHHAREPVATEA
ncbi:uncharacterized protein LOC106711842 [Papilio machaon]|uniref:uncharacterized protein LOC106711842 n=1 Tax=Papilio machaon TaxID=76193 RepID=UPI001E6636C2|nr:uncharacterized protein LOC106711842 [Papilio machaon]